MRLCANWASSSHGRDLNSDLPKVRDEEMFEKDGKSSVSQCGFLENIPFQIFPASWHQYSPIAPVDPSIDAGEAWMLGVRPGWTALSVDGQNVQTKD